MLIVTITIISAMSVPVLLNAEVSSRQNGSHGYYCITEQLTDLDIANKQGAMKVILDFSEDSSSSWNYYIMKYKRLMIPNYLLNSI